MTDHLVVIPKGGWVSWKESVRRSRVRFNGEQFRLGEELIEHTRFPEKNRILKVRDYYSSLRVKYLHEIKDLDKKEAVHPLLLLSLAAGIEGAKDDSIFHHMQYPIAMSPFLLSDASGENYIFLLRNDQSHFSGEFKPLSKDDYLPRCTHIWGYVPEEEPSHENPFFTFCLRRDGKYGPYVKEWGSR